MSHHGALKNENESKQLTAGSTSSVEISSYFFLKDEIEPVTAKNITSLSVIDGAITHIPPGFLVNFPGISKLSLKNNNLLTVRKKLGSPS